MCRSTLLLAVTFAPLPALAADITLKPVHRQQLEHRVLIDSRGNPWFLDADGVRGLDNKVICPQLAGEPLLVDRAGRVWWRAFYEGRGLTHYDGKRWDDTGKEPDAIHEDAAGRVIAHGTVQVGDIRMTHTLRVFADDKWVEESLPDWDRRNARIAVTPHFATDAKGRTWFWLEQYTGWGVKESAVWAFDGKAWAGHAVAGRTPGESIDRLLPFNDDWFLVIASNWESGSHRQRAFAWCPSRTADETAKANPFVGLPLDGLAYRGTGAAGVRYFSPPHAVTADRKVAALTPGELERGTRLAADAAGVIGRDKDGRVYVTRGEGLLHERRTWVFWPEKETPDQTLRLTAYPPAQDRSTTHAALFADSAGFAFACVGAEHLLAWDGKTAKWIDTPVARLPKAHWIARPSPPAEHDWANFRYLGYVCGTDGRTAVVRVKTKYVPVKETDPLRERTEFPKVEADAPFYVYEAWTHKGGGWSDPQPPAELFLARRKDLIAGLAVPQTPSGPVPVISHAGRLWYALDWKVYAVDADGTVHSADLPKPEPEKVDHPRHKPTPPLMLASLTKLDDKALLLTLSGADTKTYKVQFRGVKPMGVRVEEVDRPKPAASPTLAPPLAVMPDGARWCPPHDPNRDDDAKKGRVVLYRVAGEKAERFVWPPGEWEHGFEKPADGAAVFTLPTVGLVCLEPGKDGAKPRLRVRHLTEPASGQPVLTATGHVLFADRWGVLFDPKAK